VPGTSAGRSCPRTADGLQAANAPDRRILRDGLKEALGGKRGGLRRRHDLSPTSGIELVCVAHHIRRSAGPPASSNWAVEWICRACAGNSLPQDFLRESPRSAPSIDNGLNTWRLSHLSVSTVTPLERPRCGLHRFASQVASAPAPAPPLQTPSASARAVGNRGVERHVQGAIIPELAGCDGDRFSPRTAPPRREPELDLHRPPAHGPSAPARSPGAETPSGVEAAAGAGHLYDPVHEVRPQLLVLVTYPMT